MDPNIRFDMVFKEVSSLRFPTTVTAAARALFRKSGGNFFYILQDVEWVLEEAVSFGLLVKYNNTYHELADFLSDLEMERGKDKPKEKEYHEKWHRDIAEQGTSKYNDYGLHRMGAKNGLELLSRNQRQIFTVLQDMISSLTLTGYVQNIVTELADKAVDDVEDENMPCCSSQLVSTNVLKVYPFTGVGLRRERNEQVGIVSIEEITEVDSISSKSEGASSISNVNINCRSPEETASSHILQYSIQSREESEVTGENPGRTSMELPPKETSYEVASTNNFECLPASPRYHCLTSINSSFQRVLRAIHQCLFFCTENTKASLQEEKYLSGTYRVLQQLQVVQRDTLNETFKNAMDRSSQRSICDHGSRSTCALMPARKITLLPPEVIYNRQDVQAARNIRASTTPSDDSYSDTLEDIDSDEWDKDNSTEKDLNTPRALGTDNLNVQKLCLEETIEEEPVFLQSQVWSMSFGNSARLPAISSQRPFNAELQEHIVFSEIVPLRLFLRRADCRNSIFSAQPGDSDATGTVLSKTGFN